MLLPGDLRSAETPTVETPAFTPGRMSFNRGIYDYLAIAMNGRGTLVGTFSGKTGLTQINFTQSRVSQQCLAVVTSLGRGSEARATTRMPREVYFSSQR